MRRILTVFAIALSLGLTAQSQIDFRGLFSLNLEKKLTQSISVTSMNIGILTYDFQELGFGMFDGGIKYRLTKNFSTNFNYRFILRRNLENFYDNRHALYADIDFSKGINRWSFNSTVRFQSLFYSHIIEGYRTPRFYFRTKASVHYRINYYWQPFAEAEVFIPVHNFQRKRPDQVRASIGTAYTLNDHVKLECYVQLQQQVNRSPDNTCYLLAINTYFRY